MAALDIDKFQQAFKKLFEAVAKEIPNITQKRALNSIALIRKRIIDQGLNYNEVSFTPYSEAWAKKRKEAGRQTAHKDFFFADKGQEISTRMLNSLKIVNTGRDAEGYYAEINVKGEDNLLKLEGLSEQEGITDGSIIQTSKAENKVLTEDFDDDLQQIINKNGFGK